MWGILTLEKEGPDNAEAGGDANETRDLAFFGILDPSDEQGCQPYVFHLYSDVPCLFSKVGSFLHVALSLGLLLSHGRDAFQSKAKHA